MAKSKYPESLKPYVVTCPKCEKDDRLLISKTMNGGQFRGATVRCGRAECDDVVAEFDQDGNQIEIKAEE